MDEAKLPRDLVQELLQAGKDGDVDKIRQLVREEGVDVNSRGNLDEGTKTYPVGTKTALMLAAVHNHPDAILALGALGANTEIATEESNFTAVTFAASSNAVTAIDALHELGANLNNVDFLGWTPAKRAEKLGRFGALKKLNDLGGIAEEKKTIAKKHGFGGKPVPQKQDVKPDPTKKPPRKGWFGLGSR